MPVVGVIPYTDIKLEDEDILTDFGCVQKTKQLFSNENVTDDTADYLSFMDTEFDRIAEHFKLIWI